MSQTNQNAKFTFFYLLSLVALFFMAFFSGAIWFQLISKYIPDTLNYSGTFNGEFLNFAIAAVLVATPIYFLTIKWIKKGLKSGELSADSGLRKWLTYLIIFAASVTSIGWLIGVISMYLSGGLTSQFIFKALTAMIISIGVLAYYIYDIKRESFEKKDKTSLIYFIVSLVLIVTTLVFGFIIADGPAKSRMIKHDIQVLNEVQSIKYEVDAYYQTHDKTLPSNLTQLNRQSTGKFTITYKTIDNQKYEVCSDFQMNGSDLKGNQQVYFEDRFLNFNVGYSCLQFDITILDANVKPMN
ncbi:MAG: DUF5671 domain-containing protein [Patescibacteria group bacterium]